ncbi:unnamed protein product [Caenorhabditis nigoni]
MTTKEEKNASIDESTVSQKRFKLKHVFKNVKKFKEGVLNFSEWEERYNVKWQMEVVLCKNWLAFRVHCQPISPLDKWSIRTELECEFVDTWEEDYQNVISFFQFLASQSPVFKTLLLGNFSESKKSEVKLNGIEPEDFHYFLEVLYGESAIDDTTVERVALLADMYDAPTAMRRCEEFLLKESKKTLKRKLEIANRYNLKKLLNGTPEGKIMKKVRAMALDAPNDDPPPTMTLNLRHQHLLFPRCLFALKEIRAINLDQMASCFTDGSPMEPCGQCIARKYFDTIYEPHMEDPDKTRDGGGMECGDYRS